MSTQNNYRAAVSYLENQLKAAKKSLQNTPKSLDSDSDIVKLANSEVQISRMAKIIYLERLQAALNPEASLSENIEALLLAASHGQFTKADERLKVIKTLTAGV